MRLLIPTEVQDITGWPVEHLTRWHREGFVQATAEVRFRQRVQRLYGPEPIQDLHIVRVLHQRHDYSIRWMKANNIVEKAHELRKACSPSDRFFYDTRQDNFWSLRGELFGKTLDGDIEFDFEGVARQISIVSQETLDPEIQDALAQLYMERPELIPEETPIISSPTVSRDACLQRLVTIDEVTDLYSIPHAQLRRWNDSAFIQYDAEIPVKGKRSLVPVYTLEPLEELYIAHTLHSCHQYPIRTIRPHIEEFRFLRDEIENDPEFRKRLFHFDREKEEFWVMSGAVCGGPFFEAKQLELDMKSMYKKLAELTAYTPEPIRDGLLLLYHDHPDLIPSNSSLT